MSNINDTAMVVAAEETDASAPVGDEMQFNLLHQVHRLLRGRYLIAGALALLGAAAGAVVGYRMTTPTYQSTGLIRVKPSLPRILYENDQNGVMPMFEAFVGSQVALMESQRVIDVAMQHPDWKALKRGLSAEEVAQFSESLSATHPRGSELILVTFADPNPEVARIGVAATIDAYDRLYGENDSESTQARLTVLETRRKDLAAELQGINDKILAVVDNATATSIVQLYQSNLQRMLDLETQLQQAEIAVAMSGGAHVPTTQPATNGRLMPVEELAIHVPEVARLVAQRRDLEFRVAVDRRQLGDNHRSVHEGTARLEALIAQFDEVVDYYQHLFAQGVEQGVKLPVGVSVQQLKETEANLRTLHARVKAETEVLARRCTEVEQLQAKAAEAKAKLTETAQRIDQLNTEAGVGGRISIESRGDRPLGPAKDQRKLFAAGGAFALGGLGLGSVMLLGLLDRRIRHISDVQEPRPSSNGKRILGVLPYMADGELDSEDATIAAHGVHQVRMMLQHRIQSGRTPVIAVTSASPGAGKTSLTLALGLSFAASGARTLLIDCDIIGGGLTAKMKKASRRRIGHVLRRLGLINTEQLIAALKESSARGERVGETLIRQGLVTEADVEHALAVQQDAIVGLREALQGDPANECITSAGTPRLSVMPLGSAQRQHVAQLSYPALLRVIEQVRKWFDVVILDTGPILGSLEASVAAMGSDGVVMTVATGEQRPLVHRAIEQLQASGGRLMGIVMNRASVGEILSSGFSSSTSRLASSPQREAAAATVADVDHQYLRLGPISNAVVALAEFPTTGKNN